MEPSLWTMSLRLHSLVTPWTCWGSPVYSCTWSASAWLALQQRGGTSSGCVSAILHHVELIHTSFNMMLRNNSWVYLMSRVRAHVFFIFFLLTSYCVFTAPSLWVPVRGSIRLDDVRVHRGYDLQHHLPDYRPFRWAPLGGCRFKSRNMADWITPQSTHTGQGAFSGSVLHTAAYRLA